MNYSFNVTYRVEHARITINNGKEEKKISIFGHN